MEGAARAQVQRTVVPAWCAHHGRAPRPPPRGSWSWQQHSQAAAGLVRGSHWPRSRQSEAPWPDLDQTERGRWSFLGPGWDASMSQREPGNAPAWRPSGGSSLVPLESMGVWTEGQGTGAGRAEPPSMPPLSPTPPAFQSPLPLHLGTTVGGAGPTETLGRTVSPSCLSQLFPLDSSWHDCDPRPRVCSEASVPAPSSTESPGTLPPASVVGKGLGRAFCLLAPLAQFLAA